MTGKFPACILNISINPELCDVNVSPSKTEVRFADEKGIFDLINFGVKNGILNADNRREIKLEKQTAPVMAYEEKPLSERIEKAIELTDGRSTEKIGQPAEYAREQVAKALEDDRIFKIKEKPVFFHSPVSNIRHVKMESASVQQRIDKPVPEQTKAHAEEVSEDTFKYISGSAFEKNPASAPVQTEARPEPQLTVIGELFAAYILCQCGDDFIMIDKHAADERIRFEKKKNELTTSSQLLLESENIDLSAEQYSALAENTDKLSDIGVEVILTGGVHCEITAAPSAFAGGKIKPSDIVIRAADLLTAGNDNLIGEIYDDLLHSRACKSAVKANDINNRLELEAIALEVWKNEKIRFCPHGRPVMVKLTKREIEKYFSRLV